MTMTEDQIDCCAIALFANGWDRKAVALALGLSRNEAQERMESGAEKCRSGMFGHMASAKHPDGKPVVRVENNDGPDLAF